MRRHVFFALIALLALAGCRHAPDEQQVRDAIARASAAAEASEPRKVLAEVGDDFDGNRGTLDRDGLAGLLRLQLLRGQRVHALVGPIDVERRGERLLARFTLTLSGGEGTLPERAGVYRVETAWRREDGEWRCYSATWERAL